MAVLVHVCFLLDVCRLIKKSDVRFWYAGTALVCHCPADGPEQNLGVGTLNEPQQGETQDEYWEENNSPSQHEPIPPSAPMRSRTYRVPDRALNLEFSGKEAPVPRQVGRK